MLAEWARARKALRAARILLEDDLLEEKMAKKGLLEKQYVSTMRNFYKLSRMILHREIKEIKGEEFDRYFKEAHMFVDRIKRFIENKRDTK